MLDRHPYMLRELQIMATSAKPEQHANLIRRISRDTTGSSRSSRGFNKSGDDGSQVSDFDPDNEAIISTKRIDDYVQQLPELRTSAKKFSRIAPKGEPIDLQLNEDFAINTSAIGRAFPDFSQGPSTEDNSMSIEIGRGLSHDERDRVGADLRRDDSILNSQLDLDNSLDLSLPTIDGYRVTRTPPLNSKSTRSRFSAKEEGRDALSIQHRRPSNLRNEISVSAAKTKDYGSSDSAKGSGDHGPSLAAMHARLQDENDRSSVHDARPPTIDITVKSTRFGQTKGKSERELGDSLPTKFSSTHGLQRGQKSPKHDHVALSTVIPQGTQQSFMLPDMPNISELISGVFEDGTPVFSRHGKSRSTRIGSRKKHKPAFTGVDEIPIPEEEQAIFLSLKLLQDKVSILERTNAEAQNLIEDLQLKNNQLLAEQSSRRRVSHRSDSALGSTDSEVAEEVSSKRKVAIEKNRK